jgi:hypothetical protein
MAATMSMAATMGGTTGGFNFFNKTISASKEI